MCLGSSEVISERLANKVFCCETMYIHVNHECHDCADAFECPDNVIFHDIGWDEYGIINHDGGASVYQIYYCPWCGSKLPESKRMLWFAELEKMGIEDPLMGDVPDEYVTDDWFKS